MTREDGLAVVRRIPQVARVRRVSWSRIGQSLKTPISPEGILASRKIAISRFHNRIFLRRGMYAWRRRLTARSKAGRRNSMTAKIKGRELALIKTKMAVVGRTQFLGSGKPLRGPTGAQ